MAFTKVVPITWGAETLAGGPSNQACPSDPEDTADHYILGHLAKTPGLHETYEAHLLMCENCRLVVLDSERFRLALYATKDHCRRGSVFDAPLQKPGLSLIVESWPAPNGGQGRGELTGLILPSVAGAARRIELNRLIRRSFWLRLGHSTHLSGERGE